jgi:hypothetical protein
LKIVVLKELPQGHQPGAVIDEIDAAARIWISIGAARLATDDDVKSPRRGGYRRRDVQAQQPTT